MISELHDAGQEGANQLIIKPGRVRGECWDRSHEPTPLILSHREQHRIRCPTTLFPHTIGGFLKAIDISKVHSGRGLPWNCHQVVSKARGRKQDHSPSIPCHRPPLALGATTVCDGVDSIRELRGTTPLANVCDGSL